MTDQAIDTIRKANAALNARDYEALFALLDPEIEFVDHMPLPDAAQAASGPEEIRTVLHAWRDGFAGFEAHVEEYIDLGDFAVCTTSWRFVSKDKRIELEWRGAEAWQVRNGKIGWGQAGFPDRAAALEAVQAHAESAG